MTLILTFSSPSFVIQVADRLVTRRSDQGPVQFDSQSNKSIVFHAKDALVTIGYSGSSYSEERLIQSGRCNRWVPTDEWFVRLLTGQDFDRASHKPNAPPMSLGQPSQEWVDQHWPTLEEALGQIRRELDHVYVRLTPADLRKDWVNRYFGLAIGGWQWDQDGTARPVMKEIVKPPGERRCEIDDSGLCLDPHKVGVSAVPRTNISNNEWRLLVDRIDRRGRRAERTSVEDMEALLAETIQRVSERSTVVGRNCMSTVVCHPATGQARARHISSGAAKVVLRASEWSSEAETAYAPWIVTAGLVSPPAMISGRMEIGSGPYTITIEGPSVSMETPDGGTIQGFFSSQQRPVWPVEPG